jgi:hypothetical protein
MAKMATSKGTSAPDPDQLAGRAARRRRARTSSTAVAAALAIAMVATTAILSLSGIQAVPPQTTPDPSGTTMEPTVPASPRPCVSYTTGADVDAVDPAQWPDFVNVVVNGLLAGGASATVTRSDFKMSSGHAWCDLPGETYGAHGRAVISLDDKGSAGLLVIEVFIAGSIALRDLPGSCADREQNLRQNQELLFCDEATPASPMSFGVTPTNPSPGQVHKGQTGPEGAPAHRVLNPSSGRIRSRVWLLSYSVRW